MMQIIHQQLFCPEQAVTLCLVCLIQQAKTHKGPVLETIQKASNFEYGFRVYYKVCYVDCRHLGILYFDQ